MSTPAHIAALGATGPRSVAADGPKVAVVIPCYRVGEAVFDVIAAIGPEVSAIYVVDDRCPEATGDAVEARVDDPRVQVVRHESNQGVGGATLSGYRAALADGCDVLVKLDGDGQMDPAMIPRLIGPICDGEADYAKGNRFFDLDGLRPMPPARLFGNAVLSFFSKASSGYWNLFDPTNGFTAIHANVARVLPLDKISRRYFFESDMLFRLGAHRAVVCDVPMPARYGDERSNLSIARAIPEFAFKHLRNFTKRIIYNYFLRDVNVGSLELLSGLAFLLFGIWFGAAQWIGRFDTGEFASSGTVMLSALPVIIGVQLLLAFLTYDLQNVPSQVLHRRLR